MNEVTTQLSADLPTITAEINAYKRVAGEAIFEIGRRLKHVKENDLAHGEWMRWLADEVQFTDRQARRFMQVVDEFKTDDVVRIGSSKIFELLQLPSDIDRNDFVSHPHTIPSTGATKTVEEMTVRELREVKAALKEARERCEQEREAREKAEADYATVRNTLESIQPRVEIRTEYVKVTDDTAADRLRRYEEKFGDIEIYEEGVVRIDGISDISASLQTFSYEARALMKKYGFLAQFSGELKRMHGAVIEDYGAAIDAMYEFSRTMRDVIDSAKTGARVINI